MANQITMSDIDMHLKEAKLIIDFEKPENRSNFIYEILTQEKNPRVRIDCCLNNDEKNLLLQIKWDCGFEKEGKKLIKQIERVCETL